MHEFGAGGADCFVRFLRVLDLGLVLARRVWQVLRTELLADQRARGVDRLRTQRRRVRAHVGDEAVLVQALRGAHRALRGVAQLARGFLLQRRRRERRVRPLGVGLLFDVGDRGRLAVQFFGDFARDLLAEQHEALGFRLQLAGVGVKVAAGGHPLVPEALQARGERRCITVLARKRRVDAPVLGGHKAHALAFAFDDEAHGDALHAAGREARAHLLPEQRRDRVAVEAVDDAARFLGLDEVHVDLPRVHQGLQDGGLGDFVEHEALGLALRLQFLQQVPRDRLPFTVFVCCQVQDAGILDHALQLLQVVLLVGRDHVERLEVVLDVDAEFGPLLLLEFGGHLAGVRRQIADVADAGLDPVVGAEELADRAGLRRRLDDHEGGALILLTCHEGGSGTPC